MERLSQAEQRAFEECPYKGVSGKMWMDGFVEGSNYCLEAVLTIAKLSLIKHDHEKQGLLDLINRIEELKGGRP